MPAKKSSVKRAAASSRYVSVRAAKVPERLADREKEILDFYALSKKQAAKQVRESGIFTTTGKLKSTYK